MAMKKMAKTILYAGDDWRRKCPHTDLFVERFGCEICSVGNYHDAIYTIEETPTKQFDILITEYTISSKGDGITLLNKFKQMNSNSKTFLISSEEDKGIAEEAESAGVTEVLNPLFDINKFIRQHIER